MAKLAVILFLFALCSVAITARLAQTPFEEMQVKFQDLANQFEQHLQDPKLKQSWGNYKDAAKQFTDSFQAKISATPKP